MLNARQFGLKLIANVTYGYTAAGFSGRMPMAELADSIVQVPDARASLLFDEAVPHSFLLSDKDENKYFCSYSCSPLHHLHRAAGPQAMAVRCGDMVSDPHAM